MSSRVVSQRLVSVCMVEMPCMTFVDKLIAIFMDELKLVWKGILFVIFLFLMPFWLKTQ